MMLEKYVLFTNLKWVTIGDVRTYTYALLLQDCELVPGERGCQVRGFGTDATWPTFDIFVKGINYEVIPPTSGSRVGLKLVDGPKLELSLADFRRPLDVQTFEADPKDEIVLRVWHVLRQKVAEYWRAPRIPIPQWISTDGVRVALKEMLG